MMIDLDGTPNKSKLGQMPFLVFLLLLQSSR
jgi:enolase